MRFVHRRIEQRPLDSGPRAGSPMGSTAERKFSSPSMPVTKAALPGVSQIRAASRNHFLYIGARHGGKATSCRWAISRRALANSRLERATSAIPKVP